MVELKSTSKAIHDELVARGVKVEVISAEDGVMRYFWNDSWHLLRSSTPETSSFIGGMASDRKPLASAIANILGVPTPAMCVISSVDDPQIKPFLKKHRRVVLKPEKGSHGHGVTVDITSLAELQPAIDAAVEFMDEGDRFVLQQQVVGDDIRVLVIGGRYAATAQRMAARVTGDGQHTIRQLIKVENSSNPKRGENYEKILNRIDLGAAERYLGARLDAEVPPKGTEIQVVGTANIGTGGEALDLTDELKTVSPQMIEQAEALAKTMKLDCCGVDFLRNQQTGEYYFIEINACPSFGLHLSPSKGQPQPVTKLFVDFLLQP